MAARNRGAALVRVLVLAGTVGCVSGSPATVWAQGVTAVASLVGPPRFDVTIGVGIVTGGTLGAGDANLRANAPTLQNYPLFSTASELGPAIGLDARVAAVVRGRASLEAQIRLSQPTLTTLVTDDVESGEDVSLATPLTEMLIGGGIRVRLDDLRRTTRLMPHVSAGAGVVRQTYDGGAYVEQRSVFYLGGGVRYGLGARPRGYDRQGVRVDAQWLMSGSRDESAQDRSGRASVSGGVFFNF